MSTETITAGDRDVEISNADKVLFPGDGVTKLDLARYYARIADTALPHWRDRPLTLRRFPDGIDESGFFQKNAPDYFPDWIARVKLPKQGGTVTHALATELRRPSTWPIRAALNFTSRSRMPQARAIPTA